MKFATTFFAAALLVSGSALAQSYSTGQKVEAMNSVTGKYESATIMRVDGGRYLLHSDNAAVDDWDVAVNDIRAAGSSSSSVSSGSLGSLPASNAPAPLSTPQPEPAAPGNSLPQDGR